jgi:hypothetical protein
MKQRPVFALGAVVNIDHHSITKVKRKSLGTKEATANALKAEARKAFMKECLSAKAAP